MPTQNFETPSALAAVKSDGTIVVPSAAGDLTLTAGTYFIELEGSLSTRRATLEALLKSVHLKWSAALAATITFEWTNFLEKLSIPTTAIGQLNHPAPDVATIENAGTGLWVQDNVATDTYASPVIGASNTITALTIVAGGANAGAVGVQLANRSAARYRLKVVVTVGGTLRVGFHARPRAA
jgi:hypothetical protein